MKLKATIFIFFCLNFIHGQNSNELFFDDFNSNVNNWYEDSDAKRTFSVRDGFYYFEHKQTTGSWMTSQNITIDVNQDYKITSAIKKISGVANNGFGLDWGTSDKYYEFMIQQTAGESESAGS